MKILQVPYFSLEDTPASLTQVSNFLDHKTGENIAIAPWREYNDKPIVRFSIAHSGHLIFLKYYVNENEVRAVYTKVNEPVYRDSCVEFFIAFEGDDSYYNFEFNSNGVCLASFGKGREDRKMLPVEVIHQIKCLKLAPQLSKDQSYYWELCLALPVTVFCFHQLTDVYGKLFKANFYKCGDDLPEPHFLVWNNIESKEPDFHLPQFFGTLIFDQHQS